jgi:predicted DNA-binding protein (MmcQ/YjbR family)
MKYITLAFAISCLMLLIFIASREITYNKMKDAHEICNAELQLTDTWLEVCDKQALTSSHINSLCRDSLHICVEELTKRKNKSK